MFKKSIMLLMLVVSVYLTGCASVPMASLEADSNAKQFASNSNKANIYLYRNESFGGAVAMPVTLNGQMAGRTGPKTYFYWPVEPGEYEIASLTENTARIKVNARAGRNHYIWQEVKMGTWAARSELHEVSEEEGRKGVRECKLAIATNQSAPTKVTSVKAAESTQNKAASVEAPTLKGTQLEEAKLRADNPVDCLALNGNYDEDSGTCF